jgi:hypothetical protein
MTQTALNRADKWIYTALGDSTDLLTLVGDRIYRNKAPLDTAFPCLIFACQSGIDMNVVGGARLVTQAHYAVRAVVRIPVVEDVVDAVAAAADEALITAAADSYMLAIERTEPLNRSYTIAGIDYEERGGVYRVYLKGG